jgi:hypothetical protein
VVAAVVGFVGVVNSGNAAVIHFGHAIGELKDAIVMGDDDDTAARGAGDFVHKFHDATTILAVEGGGGFVGDEEARFVDEGAGDGDTLLLAAGELGGALRVPCRRGRGAGAAPRRTFLGLVTAHAVEEERHGDVLGEIEGGDQVELLENESDVLATERGDPGLGQAVEAGAKDIDGAGVPVEGAGSDGEQGRLAATRGADEEVEFALGRGEVGSLERLTVRASPVPKALTTPRSDAAASGWVGKGRMPW